MSEHIPSTHERTDDILVISAFLLQMRVAELLAKHFPPKGHGTGVSLGQLWVVWLSCIIAAGAPRLYPVAVGRRASTHDQSRFAPRGPAPRWHRCSVGAGP
jgi:hypothetical protein